MYNDDASNAKIILTVVVGFVVVVLRLTCVCQMW